MKPLWDLCPTRELCLLFHQMGTLLPGIWRSPWTLAAIHVIDGKRALCLVIADPRGGSAFAHFHPDGFTEEQMKRMAADHGHDDIEVLGNEPEAATG